MTAANLNYLSPYIRVAADSLIEAPWFLRERVIFDYELLYVKAGEILVTVEAESYRGIPGDIFFFRPKQRHSIRITSCSPLRQPHIHFDLYYRDDSPEVKVSFKALDQMNEAELKLFREDVAGEGPLHLPNQIRLRHPGVFEEMLFALIKEYEMKMPFYEMEIKGLFMKLWTYLIRENHWNNNPAIASGFEGLMRLKDYITRNIDQEISLDQLAREFNISKYHLNRLFKKAFAMSPIHYHQLLRIQKAKEMIQFTDKTVTKIADMCGFSSINSFSRAFRNVEGVPPSFYRVRNG